MNLMSKSKRGWISRSSILVDANIFAQYVMNGIAGKTDGIACKMNPIATQNRMNSIALDDLGANFLRFHDRMSKSKREWEKYKLWAFDAVEMCWFGSAEHFSVIKCFWMEFLLFFFLLMLNVCFIVPKCNRNSRLFLVPLGIFPKVPVLRIETGQPKGVWLLKRYTEPLNDEIETESTMMKSKHTFTCTISYQRNIYVYIFMYILGPKYLYAYNEVITIFQYRIKKKQLFRAAVIHFPTKRANLFA